jgi:hypothetical protein
MTRRHTEHQPTPARLARQSLHLAKEVRAIQHRAAEHDGRIVSIGPLVFFSTDTGDAWLLEPAGQLAVRLAQAGDPLPVHIEETDTSYAIGWQGSYRIDGSMFVTKTPNRTVSLQSKATRCRNSFALSIKPAASSSDAPRSKFQICLARIRCIGWSSLSRGAW